MDRAEAMMGDPMPKTYSTQEKARQWDDLMRRLKLAGPNEGQGQAVVSIRIFIQDGCPVFWSEPTRIKIEPRKLDIMGMLCVMCDGGAADEQKEGG